MLYRQIAFAGVALCLAAGPVFAAEKPSEAEVKTIIEKRDNGKDKDFTFRSVMIAAPRKASGGEISSAGLPPNATIVPVKVDYSEDTGGGWLRDHVQTYYFYRDDFGAWAQQAISTTGNFTSEPHRK